MGLERGAYNAARDMLPDNMIRSFRDKDAEGILQQIPSRRYGALNGVIRRKLIAIDSAEMLEDLREPPCNRLETLRGDRKGQYSIRVNQQYRICFRWEGNHAYEVEITDYH
jgi:proteic killer suppression protein